MPFKFQTTIEIHPSQLSIGSKSPMITLGTTSYVSRGFKLHAVAKPLD